MARTLNNEVDVLNIASLDNDIKDSFTRAMITEDVNTTSAAARRYLEGEYFIHTDRYLYKALEDIAAGTTITPDVNAEVVTVSGELVRLFAQSPEGIFEILSNIENTSVASKNYVKGAQFIWTDKNLYEATADIASGSTFVVGTNIKLADNLTSQIQTLTNNDDAMLNVLGAKNLINQYGTSQTLSGVTFTVNADKTITANGTASEQITLAIWDGKLPSGRYIKSGCPSGGSNSTYFIGGSAGTSTGDINDYGDGYEFETTDSSAISMVIVIRSGITVSNLLFKPMIRPASVADDTYVPHAMTNRELTDYLMLEWKYGTIVSSKLSSEVLPRFSKSGKTVRVQGTIILTAAITSSSETLFTVPAGWEPAINTGIQVVDTYGVSYLFMIYTDGTVALWNVSKTISTTGVYIALIGTYFTN